MENEKEPAAPKAEQWEYSVQLAGTSSLIEGYMDQMGTKGWEAFSVVHDGRHFVAFLKRRKK